MKKFNLLMLFAFAIVIFSSCEEETIYNMAYGIRHDKSLAEYEEVATNNSPYTTDLHPDFSPVIMFGYSLDGTPDVIDYVASGVLVSEDWILTAGHNFFVAEEQDEPAPVEGITVFIGNDPNNPISTNTVAELVFFPTWIEVNNDFLNANDLCLVRLTDPITNITPAEINFQSSETIGGTLWYCGFGDYSQQFDQNPDLLSRKHAIENVLDRKVDGITSTSGDSTYYGGLLAFDFDSPTGEVNSLGDDEVYEDEELLGDGTSDATATTFEGATIPGDSGGPIFMYIDGTWKVCGILSGGANYPFDEYVEGGYGDISVFIRVSSHADWIYSVIQ